MMEISEMKKLFTGLLGDSSEPIRSFAAPGRVNLIGEHVDYCGGAVMPAALTMRTTLLARKRSDRLVRMRATDLDICVEVSIPEIPFLKETGAWGDYQIGVAAELLKEGYDLCGCDLLYDDTVPHGGGLSSSAAIEVSTALCLATFANEKTGREEKIDMVKMALIAQRAEHNFIGVKCGIMDQFTSAMGKKDHALFLDCKTLEYEHIPLKIPGYSLVVTNTNVKHSLGASKYNQRRKECEDGLFDMRTVLPDISQLADITPAQFEKHKEAIRDEVTRKRVAHVVYECDRVRKSKEALCTGNIAEFGALMNASHDSLKKDCEVTCPELDFIVTEGRKIPGVFGIRMTGAGFGGCTVAVIKDDVIDTYTESVRKAYIEKFNRAPSFYITQIGDGAAEIK